MTCQGKMLTLSPAKKLERQAFLSAYMRLLLFLLPSLALGQDLLAPVIVTATRSDQELANSPYSVEVLSAESLEKNATRSLPQAFLDTPGVLVQQTTPAHGSPYIRGFNGRQTLLLQDGVRLNNSTWRGGPVQYWNTLDSQAIDRIELIRSQGSVLYGSDAIGGTVNVFSKSSLFREEAGFFSHGSASYRFDTNSRSHVGRVEQRLGDGGKWGLTLGASAKDIGDIRDSAVGRMRGTGYKEDSFDLKFEYALSDSATLTLAHSYLNQDDIDRFHNTINNSGWTHGNSFTTAGTDLSRLYDQERSLSYLRLDDHSPAVSWLNSYQLTLSYQKTQDSELRTRGSGRVDHRVLDVDTYGFSLQANSDLGPGTLVWGADYYRDEVDSSGSRNGADRPANRPVADDASYDSLGVFSNYSHSLTERLNYTLGARFTYARADWNGFQPDGATTDQSGDADWTNLSFSARGIYDLRDEWALFGGVSQAFRAPNLDDLTGSQFSLNGLDSNGSPDVDPETYITYELGTRYTSESVSAEIAAYYTTIDDAIIRIRDGAGGLVSTNGGSGDLFGIEAEAAWRFHPQWELSGHIAWQDGNQSRQRILGGESINDTIRRLHPLTGSTALTWTSESGNIWITGRITAAGRQDNLSSLASSDTQRIPVNGTPGYIVGSLYTGWQVNDALELGLALENLTDEVYRIHGSGQNQPGFNSTLSVKVKW